MKHQKKHKQLKPGDMAVSEKHIQLQSSSTTPEEIRERAYLIYLARGGANGHELDDWLQAERELTTGEYSPATI